MKTLEQKRDKLRAKLEEVEKQIKEQKPADGWPVISAPISG